MNLVLETIAEVHLSSQGIGFFGAGNETSVKVLDMQRQGPKLLSPLMQKSRGSGAHL